MRKRTLVRLALLTLLFLCILPVIALASEGGAEAPAPGMFHATVFALLPPVIAIVLALLTKEVYSSLFIGIVAGALLHADFNLEKAFNAMLTDGFVAKLADGWNVGILIFLVVLGIMVVLMNQAGGSAAYGRWAARRIRTRQGALAATFGLGVLIFIDDYFNCLTVGSVMRPVTDKHRISRAKLAYLIDATAAPVCMIAPISSWAAAVAGVAEGYNGLELFIRAIPYNFYSLLTFVMIIYLIVTRFDFGPMKRHEDNAVAGDLYTTAERPYQDASETVASTRGKVIDLVVPVLLLIVCSVLGMIYTGGFFSGTSFVDAFSGCDASKGLSMGSLLALLLSFFFYVPRRVLTFRQYCDAIPAGFKAMVPAILILTFAWTLSAMTKLLGAADFVAGIVQNSASGLSIFLPAIIFLIAVGLSFATGTSWGTFGILIPIIVAVLDPASEMLVIGVSACLAGAVCGDHCSPISDTTIMSSTGAQCDHINHVTTQLPYALLVAGVSFLGYIVAGLIPNVWIALPISILLMLATLSVVRLFASRRTATTETQAAAEPEA